MPAVAALGFELVGCAHIPQGRYSTVRVYIDNPPGGVTVDDCQLVSRQISSVLEVEDPITGGYSLEAALAMATKKLHGADIAVRVAIDRNTGDYETFRTWTVVEDEAAQIIGGLEFPGSQMTLSDAKQRQPALEIDDTIEEPMQSVEF